MSFKTTAELGDNKLLRGLFYDEYQALQEDPWVPAICGIVQDSNRGLEEYGFLSQMPGLQLFLGRLNVSSPTLNELMVANDDYEASIEIPDKELRRDGTGQLRKYMGSVADSSGVHWMEMASDLILGGATTKSFDDVYFFSASHPCGDPGGSTYSNLFTYSDCPALDVVTATAPTPLEFATAALQVIQKFFSMKGEAGRSFNRMAKKFVIMVGNPLGSAASIATSAPLLQTAAGASVSNPLLNSQWSVSVVVNPDLDAWTTKMAVFRADSRFGPLIRQEEMKIKVEVLGEGSDHKIKTGKHLVSAKTSRGMGYQAPWTAAQATFS